LIVNKSFSSIVKNQPEGSIYTSHQYCIFLGSLVVVILYRGRKYRNGKQWKLILNVVLCVQFTSSAGSSFSSLRCRRLSLNSPWYKCSHGDSFVLSCYKFCLKIEYNMHKCVFDSAFCSNLRRFPLWHLASQGITTKK